MFKDWAKAQERYNESHADLLDSKIRLKKFVADNRNLDQTLFSLIDDWAHAFWNNATVAEGASLFVANDLTDDPQWLPKNLDAVASAIDADEEWQQKASEVATDG